MRVALKPEWCNFIQLAHIQWKILQAVANTVVFFRKRGINIESGNVYVHILNWSEQQKYLSGAMEFELSYVCRLNKSVYITHYIENIGTRFIFTLGF